MPDDDVDDNCEGETDDGEDEEGVGHEYEEGQYKCLQCKGNHYDDNDCADDSDEDGIDNEDEGGVDVDVDVDEMLARLWK